MLKRILIAAILIAVSITAVGCWGQAELNELGFVMATGVDYEGDGTYRITVMASIPVLGAAQTGERSTMWIGTATGNTIMSASKNLRKTSFKKLSWVQNSIIIIGEDAAKRGINEILDFFARNREIRFDNHVLVSEGRAIELMMSPSDIAKNLFQELEGLVLNVKEWSKAYIPDLLHFTTAYIDKGIECVAGRIGYEKTRLHTFSAPKEIMMRVEPTNETHNLVILQGSAAFKGDKFIGWLDELETRGYLWIVDEVERGTIEVIGETQHGNAVMEIISVECQRKPIVKNGELEIALDIFVKGRIVEHTGNMEFLDKSAITHLEKAFADEIKNKMQKTVYKAQKEFASDILGIGNQIYRKAPKLWREVGDTWEDIFPDVNFSYNVEVTLGRSGEILNAIKKDED